MSQKKIEIKVMNEKIVWNNIRVRKSCAKESNSLQTTVYIMKDEYILQ